METLTPLRPAISIASTDHPDRTPETPEVARDAVLRRIEALARSFVSTRTTPDDAADIVQSVVIRCWERMEAGLWSNDETRLRRLVRRMVRAQIVDGIRRTKRRRAREAEHARELAESTHAWMSPELAREERELAQLHDDIAAAIPEACLHAYALVRGDEASYEAAAKQLGLTRDSVTSHVVRAQHRFRERLKARDIHAPSRYQIAGVEKRNTARAARPVSGETATPSSAPHVEEDDRPTE